MKKRVFLIHGSLGNPRHHWFPWLKEKLEGNGHEVIAPAFPISENGQHPEKWLAALESYRERLEGSVMVGHSLGAPFILDTLQDWQPRLSSAIFVAGFSGHLEEEGEPNINEFSEREFDWELIRSLCPRFVVLQSTNDPYVSMEKARELEINLKAELKVVEKAGHFCAKDGYEEFPLLLDLLNHL